MVDTRKLKARMIENGETVMSLAKKIGISTATFSNKLNNKVFFSIVEARAISNILKFDNNTAVDIFFANNVDK